MATASVGFQVTLGTPANNFVAALYDSTNPSVVLESIPVPKSGGVYPPNFQVTFVTVLIQTKIYRVILWESAGTTPTGLSRVSTDFKATLNSVNIRDNEYLTVDASPGLVSGTNTYVDPTLIGWAIWLDIPGPGTAFPGVGVDYTWNPLTGTLTYLLANWNPGQRIVIHPEPQITAAAPPSVSSVTSGQIITASRALLNTDKNQALYVQSAFSTIILNLPSLATVADYDHIVLYSSGGSHINASFPTNGTDKILRGSLITQLIAGQGEKFDFFKSNGVWNMDTENRNVDIVGEIVHKYSKADLNIFFADGSLLSRTTYPRLFAYFQTKVDANAITTEAAWNNVTALDGFNFFLNRGKWTPGDGSTTFRIPRIYEAGFLRACDGIAITAGTYEWDTMLQHIHDTLLGDFPGEPNGFGPVKLHGNYNGTSTTKTDMTGAAYKSNGAGVAATIIQRVASETHPTNLSVFASIRI